jgi:hypothetical protein
MSKRNPISLLTGVKFARSVMTWIIVLHFSSIFTAHPYHQHFPSHDEADSALVLRQSADNLRFVYLIENTSFVISENENEQDHQDNHRETAGDISRKATTTEPILVINAAKRGAPVATTVPRYLLFHCIKSDMA